MCLGKYTRRKKGSRLPAEGHEPGETLAVLEEDLVVAQAGPDAADQGPVQVRPGLGEPVMDPQPFLATDDQPVLPEVRQVSRDGRLGQSQRLVEVADAHLRVSGQEVQEPEPHRVGERLQRPGRVVQGRCGGLGVLHTSARIGPRSRENRFAQANIVARRVVVNPVEMFAISWTSPTGSAMIDTVVRESSPAPPSWSPSRGAATRREGNAVIGSEVVEVVTLTLAVSGSALMISTAVGVPLGAWLGLARFRGRRVADALVFTGMGLPPVVVGLAVYLLLSRSGPLGALGWLFTPQAMVLAQVVLALPLVIGPHRCRGRRRAGRTVAAGPQPGGEPRAGAPGRRCARPAAGRPGGRRGGVRPQHLGGRGGADRRRQHPGPDAGLTTAIVLETGKGDFASALALGGVCSWPWRSWPTWRSCGSQGRPAP